jgi:hypothetical protein
LLLDTLHVSSLSETARKYAARRFWADFYYLNRCRLGLLAEDVENNDRIRRGVVDDSPRFDHDQLRALAANGEDSTLPLLGLPEKQPSFQAGLIAERRGFHFAL